MTVRRVLARYTAPVIGVALVVGLAYLGYHDHSLNPSNIATCGVVDPYNPSGVPCPPSADLAVAKSGPATTLPGATFSYTITVTNTGPDPATSVTVTDDLPTGVTLTGTPTGDGFVCGVGDPFTCTRPSLPAGGSPVVITVPVVVSADLSAGSSLVNEVSITSETEDPASGNNAAEAETVLPACTIGSTTATSGQSLQGTNGDDVICGSAFVDTIQGRGGNDIIFGHGGNDKLQGGDGNDSVFGGAGDDALQGNDGDDTVSGGSGNDNIQGGAGNDTLDGNDGNDVLQGQGGNDTIQGGAGTDTADGGSGTDGCTAESTTNCSP